MNSKCTTNLTKTRYVFLMNGRTPAMLNATHHEMVHKNNEKNINNYQECDVWDQATFSPVNYDKGNFFSKLKHM